MDSNVKKYENYKKEVKILEDIDIESLWKKFCKEVIEKWE